MFKCTIFAKENEKVAQIVVIQKRAIIGIAFLQCLFLFVEHLEKQNKPFILILSDYFTLK